MPWRKPRRSTTCVSFSSKTINSFFGKQILAKYAKADTIENLSPGTPPGTSPYSLSMRSNLTWYDYGELATPSTNEDQCTKCGTCIDVCPTKAIIAPYKLDARRCISYLTIELDGVIPIEFRASMGNRIYGCDDCQLCCPWNRFSVPSTEKDFLTRHPLDAPKLL